MKPSITCIDKSYEMLKEDAAESDTGIQILLQECFNSSTKDFIAKLTDITSDAFGKPRPESDVKDHVVKVDRLYLAFDGKRSNNNLVGFSSYNYLRDVDGSNILYLCGIAVRKAYQKLGIFELINRIEIASCPFTPDFFVGRTQNPVIYEAMSKLVKKTYPSEQPIPFEIQKLGRALAKRLNMKDFDTQNFVHKGTYNENMYDVIPPVRAKTLFDEALKLNYERGDSVLVVGTLQ